MSRPLKVLLAACFAVSCSSTAPHLAERSLATLRRDATGVGASERARRDRALAEIVAPDGNVAEGARQLESLRSTAIRDPRVAFALATLEWQHGDFSRAADDYATTIEAARIADDPIGGALAEIAMSRLIAMRGDVNGFERRIRPAIESVVRDPGRLGAPAAVAVVETGVRWARERGAHDDEQRWVAASGCVTDWTVAGAFGPFPMLRFDETLRPESPGPLAATYDVGAGRGTRPTWHIGARGCAANLGRGRSETGVFVAATDFATERDHEAVVHVESPNVFAVLLDGIVIGTLDSRRGPTGTSVNVRVALPAGRHTLRVKVASRFSSPLLIATVTDVSGRPIARFSPASTGANPIPPQVLAMQGTEALANLMVQDPFERFTLAQLASTRHDAVSARELLRPLATAAHPTALALQSWGSVALDDPYLPNNIAHDRARRAYEAARTLDPAGYYPSLVLARLEAADNRTEEALDATREAYARFPSNPDIASELADRLMDRNWDGEAAEILARSARELPDACWPLRMQLSLAQRHADGVVEHAISERIRNCDALADSLALTNVRARRWEDARTEFERLLGDDPEGRGVRRALVDVLRQRGNLSEAARSAERILDENPEDTSLREDLADLQLALGEAQLATALLTREIARDPSNMAELRRFRSAIERREELAPWRLDGNAVLHAFEASGHHYDAAAVLVLDYTVRRVMPDGSALELTHNIIRLQSQEGVDDHATFNPPEGATLLTLRTHKADGRVLEPDNIARLEAVAFPDVHIGDAIEFEYIRTIPASEAMSGGFVADRFYFRGFDIPYDHSEFVVVVPHELAAAVRIDPRGPAPTLRRRELSGALTEYRWLAVESHRMTPEPRSVAAREFIPSIALGAHASWNEYVDALRDRLADQDPVDPDAVRVASEIVGNARQPSAQLTRLHRWVIDHIEQQGGGTPFASAPAMLAGRSGHRARVLCYLLRLRSIPCTLALVRQGGGDATESDLPDEETFPSLLLRVETEQGERWVTASQRGAPVSWIPTASAGQPGILIAAGAPRITVPPLDLSAHGRDISAHMTLAADGSGRVDVVERLRGTWAVSWREQLRQIDRANLEHEFESYVGREVTAASLVSLRIEGQDDPNADIVLRYSFTAPGLATPSGHGLAFEGLYPAELGPTYAQVPRRTTTMYNGDVVNSVLDVDVTLPSGATVPSLPHDARGSATSFEWSVQFARTSTGFRIHRTVRIAPSRISAAQYPAFASQIRAFDAADTQRVAIAL